MKESVIDLAATGRGDDLSRAAGALRHSERRFRSLVESASDLFVICGLDGAPTYISPSIRQLVGLEPADRLGLIDNDLHHPDDLPQVIEAFERAMRCGSVDVEFRVRHRDGSWRWLDMRVTTLLDDPDVQGFVLCGRDVTKRKRAEEALRQSEERWRALLLNSNDGVVVLGEAGKVIYGSPSTERMLRLPPDSLTSFDVFELVHPDDLERAATILLELISHPSEVSEPIEMRVRDVDGNYVVIECVANNLLHDPAIEGIVVNVRDISERKRAEEELARRALTDSLTGLPNRALLLDRLSSALGRAERTGSNTAVLFLDLDHFKLVNDSLGHAMGDQLLVAVAQRLRTVLRKGDTAARLGGDEFVLCCEEIAGYEEATEVAERVAAVLADPFAIDGQELSATVSIGITCAPDEARNPEELLRDADIAMYRAKERGRDRSEIFHPSMRTRTLARLEQQIDVRRALGSGQFRMTYQPVVELGSGALVGAEALVRWAHPRRGMVLPSEFIPVAEETGIIQALGTWVLAQGVAEAASWNAATDRQIGLSVNLSARQIAGGQLPELIGTALETNDLDPSLLCLEITESVLMDEPYQVTSALRELTALGVRLAIDDFGTGYSSLAYLKRFSVDLIKIDRAFVYGLERDGENQAIVTAVLALADSLGLTVVAEGVETSEQVSILRDLGCTLGQGFYFGAPVPPESFGNFLADR